ncbi:HTH cro/C1-type domain-containing protein [Halomonas sp. NYA30]
MQPPNRQELTKINKQLGKKIQDARSLAGFSRTELANLIGISVQWLKCLELGIDVDDGVPGWITNRIAQVCGVKGDFLLGLTEESEPDEPGPTWKELAYLCNKSAARDRMHYIAEIAQRDIHLAEFREMAANVDAAAKAAQAALERVAELNTQWEDMRGGARLALTITELDEAVGILGKRASVYVNRQVIAEAAETLEDLKIACPPPEPHF